MHLIPDRAGSVPFRFALLVGLSIATRAPAAPPEAAVSPPATGEATGAQEYPGRVEAMHTVELRPRVAGTLVKVLVKPGMAAREGELLMEIDARVYQAEVARAMAGVGQAKARLEKATVDVARERGLQRAAAASTADFDNAVAAREDAAAAVQSAEAALILAKLNLESTRIVAPFSGKIAGPVLDAGNIVTADKTPLATLVSTDPMFVSFDLDQRTFLRFRRLGKDKPDWLGSVPVACAFPDDKGHPYQGRLDSVDGRVDPAAGTVRCRVVLPNKDGYLMPGMSIRVRLSLGSQQNESR